MIGVMKGRGHRAALLRCQCGHQPPVGANLAGKGVGTASMLLVHVAFCAWPVGRRAKVNLLPLVQGIAVWPP